MAVGWLGGFLRRGLRARPKALQQYAALPLLTFTDGNLRVALITSRDTGRWVIPKGWPKTHKQPHEIAALEAYEEAGLKGEIGHIAIGSFHYRKRLKSNALTWCVVGVYPLHVTRQLLEWPEKASRRVAWFPPAQAADLVDEPELAELLRAIHETDAGGAAPPTGAQ